MKNEVFENKIKNESLESIPTVVSVDQSYAKKV